MSSSAPSQAKLIGSLLFCPVCSTLLDLPGDKDIIVCEQCHHEEPAQCPSPALPSSIASRFLLLTLNRNASLLLTRLTAYENLGVKTYSNPSAFPSALKAKRALVVKAEDEDQESALPVVRSRLPSLSVVPPPPSPPFNKPIRPTMGVSEAGGGERGCAGSKHHRRSLTPFLSCRALAG